MSSTGSEGSVDIVTVLPTTSMLRETMQGSTYELRTGGGQSLDDLFGTEEQLDERDPIPW